MPPAKPAEFDPRAALLFVVTAEERSFTRGAMRLGMTQPSVSEAIRRLETQLGFALFVRPSRRGELTPKGEAFLDAARRVARANDEAQALARSLRQGLEQALRIGAIYASASIPERTALIDAYMRRHPRVALRIVHGYKRDLVQSLRAGETELAILIRPFEVGGLTTLRLHTGVGHFLVPAEDPLARRAGLRLADLAGRGVVVPPPEVDPQFVATHFDPIAAAGATLVPAPESIDQAMEHFARLRRLVHLRFGLGQGGRREVGDMVRQPILGEPILLEYELVRRDEPLPPAAAAFWLLAQEIVKEGDAPRGGRRIRGVTSP